MPPVAAVDADLEQWADIVDDGPWPALLLGNGSSIAIWQHFSYGKLYEEADLTNEDVDLFDALHQTTNFQLVLDALRVSRLVCEQLGHDDDEVHERYESIKDALIAVVHDMHVPWATAQPVMAALGHALLEHDAVFSTNYDLLAYWSLMEVGGAWGDTFWNDDQVFDDTNVVPNGAMTLIHFLHGALHIYRTPEEETVKRVAHHGHNLLDLFGTPSTGADLPLFVSEGTSDDKMKVIRSSDYLSFAYGALEDDDRPLVVFGNSLSDQDAYLVRAINRHPDRHVAVGLRPGPPLTVIAAKTSIQQQLDGPVRFFDSETHPLGDPGLQLVP